MTKRRAKDEYPEFIRERILMPLLSIPQGDTCVVGVPQLQDWALPVELDLHQPTFIELNKLVGNMKPVRCQVSESSTATLNEVALQRVVTLYVLNERRTVEPLLDDNAIVSVMHLSQTHRWITTTAPAQNASYLDHGGSQLREERNYEDNLTGQGLLIAQPRLFLMAIESNSQGGDINHTEQTEIGIKMEFRLTDRVSSKEFFTEMIAKFS